MSRGTVPQIWHGDRAHTRAAADAAAEKRMVERQVTKLLTPGTLTDDSMLPARRNNFLAAIALSGEHWGLAHADISTGEFFTTQSTNLEALGLEATRRLKVVFLDHLQQLSKFCALGS